MHEEDHLGHVLRMQGFTRLTKFRKDFKLPIYAVMGSTDRCTSLKVGA